MFLLIRDIIISDDHTFRVSETLSFYYKTVLSTIGSDVWSHRYFSFFVFHRVAPSVFFHLLPALSFFPYLFPFNISFSWTRSLSKGGSWAEIRITSLVSCIVVGGRCASISWQWRFFEIPPFSICIPICEKRIFVNFDSKKA